MKADSRARARAVVTRALQDERAQSESAATTAASIDGRVDADRAHPRIVRDPGGCCVFYPAAAQSVSELRALPSGDTAGRWGCRGSSAPRSWSLAFSAAIAGAIYRVGSDAGDVIQEIPRRSSGCALRSRTRSRTTPARWNTCSGRRRNCRQARRSGEPGASARPKEPAAGSGGRHQLDAVDRYEQYGDRAGAARFGAFSGLFLLSAGDLFRRKFLRAVGGDFSRRRTTLRILDNVDRQNQRYFAIVLLVNVAVGLAIGAGFFAMGPRAPDGVGHRRGGSAHDPLRRGGDAGRRRRAGRLRSIRHPADGLARCHDTDRRRCHSRHICADLADGARCANEHAGGVRVAAVLGMLWGGWGLLLAVPIMVAIKTLCDHVERLEALRRYSRALKKNSRGARSRDSARRRPSDCDPSFAYCAARHRRTRTSSIYSSSKQFLRCSRCANPIACFRSLFLRHKLVWHEGC